MPEEDVLQANDSSNLLLSRRSTEAACGSTRSSSVFSMHHVPLLLYEINEDAECGIDLNEEEGHGTASRTGTVLNIAKTCLGTGIIALPFAASQVECWIHITGILAIALWCLVCVQRLLSCLDLVHFIRKNRKVELPNDCSGLGEVAFFAYGKVGFHAMDIIFFGLLFMIIVAYLDAALGFLQDTIFVTSNRLWNALVPAIIIGYLASGEEMESLSKVSALGIGLILMVFGILIFGYGDFDELSEWPTSKTTVANFAQWFGTTVFGFGLVPLTYNFRASMKDKGDMMLASALGLAGTSLLYIVLSVGVVLLFPATLLQGDVLTLLPNNSFLPAVVRLAMVGLVLTTAPLLVLPCGELIQDEVFPSHWSPVWIRIAICITASLLTLYLPEFVFVLSFVGSCWCILSFVIPPLFRLALLQKARQIRIDTNSGALRTDGVKPWILSDSFHMSYWIDISLLLFGITATVTSSVYAFKSLLEST
jgi:amino acid permease